MQSGDVFMKIDGERFDTLLDKAKREMLGGKQPYTYEGIYNALLELRDLREAATALLGGLNHFDGRDGTAKVKLEDVNALRHALGTGAK